MEIKIEKYVYRKMADIFIKRITCTKESVSKILDLLNLKNVVAEIGDVKKSDILFEKITQLNLKHTTSIGDESSYFDVVLMADIKQFNELIKCIFESDSESFAITSIDYEIQWEQYLYNGVPTRKLIKQGKVDVSMDVAIQESVIGISFNKEAYDAPKLISNIKSLF